MHVYHCRYKAKVKKVEADRVNVHYIQYSSAFDCWLDLADVREYQLVHISYIIKIKSTEKYKVEQ